MDANGYAIADGGEVTRIVGDALPELITGPSATLFAFTQITYLHHMSIILGVLFVVMLVMSIVNPRTETTTLPKAKIDLTPHPRRYLYGGMILAATVALYILFW